MIKLRKQLFQTSKEEIRGTGKKYGLVAGKKLARSMRESKSSTIIKESKIIKNYGGSE